MGEHVEGRVEAAGRSASDGVCEVALVHSEAVGCVRDALPDQGEIQQVAETFQLLADPTRARIVYALALEELCVCDVAAVSGLSMSAASHQLKRLRDRGVVDYRKDGRLAYYRLSDERLRALLESGVGHTLAGAAS